MKFDPLKNIDKQMLCWQFQLPKTQAIENKILKNKNKRKYF